MHSITEKEHRESLYEDIWKLIYTDSRQRKEDCKILTSRLFADMYKLARKKRQIRMIVKRSNLLNESLAGILRKNM